MKRAHTYLLLLTGLYPACVLLGYLLGKPFEPALKTVFFLILAAGILLLSEKSRGNLLILPVSLVCALACLPQRNIAAFGCGFISAASGWAVFREAEMSWKKNVLRIPAILLTALLLLAAPLWLFATVMVRNTVVRTLDSPEGRYTAIVIDADQGATGGDTLIKVRDNAESLSIGIGSFVSSKTVYVGEWREWEYMDLYWVDETTLGIHSTHYSVDAEALRLLDLLGLGSGRVLHYEDTHGGFHGDGTTVAVIDLTGHGFSPEGWTPLPMSDSLKQSLQTDLFQDENGVPWLPEIKNGFYHFYDRHSQATDPKDEGPLLTRNSRNFTAAVYDSDSRLLYYFELDT